MNTQSSQIRTVAELNQALANPDTREIRVMEDLVNVPTFRLSPGQTLTAHGNTATLRFASGVDGLQLSADNRVAKLTLVTDLKKRAIFNDWSVEQLGRLILEDLSITGVAQLLARDRVRGGHIEARDIDIVAADARDYDERPIGYGVQVIPGAFTLWNQQTDPSVTLSADLTGLSAGRAGAPVRGSGIFISGAGDVGGRLIASRLETGAVYSDGGITPGTPDRITGGVFTVYGAFIDTVRNRGPVTTYGPNDMVLDNWGTVDHWVAEEKITSTGPSGIGFVNFGTVNRLDIDAPIETFGQGSRGFNVYTGTVHHANFERIVTHGDGAVGLQISQPVGDITVRRGIETYGSTGDSLVKGVVIRLSAIALSIKPGGSARSIDIDGGICTHGEGVSPIELHGSINAFCVAGGIISNDAGAEKI